MAITQSSQQLLTRTGSDTGHDIVYVLFSSASDVDDQVADVTAWMQGNLPASYLGQDIASANYAEIGSGWWTVTARYSTEDSDNKDRSEQPEIDEEPDWRFSIATESRTIKTSISLSSVWPNNDEWDPFLGKPFPLAYDGNEVNGIDIQVPIASWEETYYFDPVDVDQTYRLNCLSLVGKVNNATFRGASAQQVLLQSVEGNKKGANPWMVTFSFLYRGNQTATYRMSDGVDRSVTTIGHQVIDFRYGRGKVADITTAVPKSIFVHEVYDYGDFSLLNIGS